ncbi:hypothetical protein JW930_00250 [Candidatus Woesearchaeota archaeon]|nr:hypothetical protein [Candidatus Woesearchaeota archaeon]
MQKKQLPDKHLSRPLSQEQEEEIRQLSVQKQIPFILAKHEYFENKLNRWL